MKLSVFFHHVRDAAKEENVSLDEMLSYVKSLGIDYLEVDAKDYAADPEGFTAMLKKHDLLASNICCMYPWMTEPNNMLDDMQIKAAKALGATKIMPIPGLYTSDALDPKELENMVHGMAALKEKAEKEGLQTCIEDFDNALSPIATMEGMKYFADNIPGLKIAFDTGNFLFSEQDARDAYALLESGIIHMHLKDRSWTPGSGNKKTTTGGRDMYPCAVGDGVIPIAEFVQAELAKGYDGIFTIEHYDIVGHKEAITRSAAFLHGLEK